MFTVSCDVPVFQLEMNPYRLIFVVLLFVTDLAVGKSSLIEVTPEKPKVEGFEITLTPKLLPNGHVEFRAVVTEKKGGRICSMPRTAISTVQITETETSMSQRVSPGRDVRHERKGNSLVCVFTVSPTELKKTNLCFTFANQAERIVDGKVRPLPSILFFYAKLAEFAKKKAPSSAPEPETE